jgi:HEAT repeat protein
LEIDMRTCLIVLLTLTVALAGCGGKSRKMREMPAPKHAPPPPPHRPMALDGALRQSARTQIEKSLASSDPYTRANAIEAAQDALGDADRMDIVSKLNDPAPVVRFAACMACGKLRLGEAHQKLLDLVHDPDMDVQIASRFALHRIGDVRYSHDLEVFARSSDPRVRGNTVMVLGLLEEKSALKILRQLKADPKPGVRLQVGEAMWRLGDEDGLTTLVAGSISVYKDDQIISLLALAAPKDRRVAAHIRPKLVGEFEEVWLAAARALGELGYDDGFGIAMQSAESPDPRIRALAALALGAIGRSDAQPALKKLLAAPEEPVRLAAATAVLQLKAG